MGRDAMRKRVRATRETPQEVVRDPFGRQEFRLAVNRVGLAPDDKLRWLLAFKKEDVAHASSGQLLDRAWEIVAFVQEDAIVYQEVEMETEPPAGVRSTMLGMPEDWSGEEPFPGSEAVVRRRVNEFHTHLREGWAALEQRHYWVHNTQGGRYALSGTFDGTQPFARWVAARLLDRFTLRAFDLFVACRDRFRRCADPACGQIFVAHKRQTFCSLTCSQRVRTAKWRAAHLSEFRASRRAAYKKRQEQD